MAEAGISVDQFSEDEFSCSICLDLLKDPVTTSCGHSFCTVCINCHWDQEDQRGVYHCPQCRETFTPRPALRRNTMLAEVVEKLKKIELQAASSALCYAGPGDVTCDFCTGRKHKATKSCLTCLASFCETHLKPHYEVPGLKQHSLVETCAELEQKICSHHDKEMEIYCRTDQSFICYLCTMEEHKGHDTVPVKREERKKESELKEDQKKSQQRIQEKQKKVQELKEAVIKIKIRAQAAEEDNERIFSEMISFMKKKRYVVTKLIRDQEKAELKHTAELMQHLEQEITDLKRRVNELKQLSYTQDDSIHFYQKWPSLCTASQCENSSGIRVNHYLSFDQVTQSLSRLKEHLEEFCEEELKKLNPQAAAIRMISVPEPKSREDFLQYSRQLTLDPNTANRFLLLSEENKAATFSEEPQPYPDHPERFDHEWQVLCKESVSGRCYWEVERSDVGSGVYISVSYKEISRKGRGDEYQFGSNNQSWSLWSFSSSSSFSSSFFSHNKIRTDLEASSSSSRIGVYVDHSAGILSFYSVFDGMKLLHRIQTTFTQPLHAGFGFGFGAGFFPGSTVRLWDPK